MPVPLLGLRTVLYPTDDLAASKAWFTQVLGFAPYFDEPFYVGFEVGGYELGLLPRSDTAPSPITYWGVADADAALADLLAASAKPHQGVSDVGGGIRTAEVVEPGGGLLGIMENPHFSLPA
jgi:catechol 2,3-dioxygenase-like lactoylglutathione lyase family enzyme